MVTRLENEHILVLGLFVVEDVVNFESHSLTRPHVGDFAEPAIYTEPINQSISPISYTHRFIREYSDWRTFDGGVSDFAHTVSAAVDAVPLKAFRLRNKSGLT